MVAVSQQGDLESSVQQRAEEARRDLMAADFKAFASGPEALASPELEAFIEKWGGDATSKEKIMSSWEWGHLPPTPLWLVAMSRSKSCCVVLAREGVPLAHPSGEARADAWRYAAFNGWAAEAAILFQEQARQGAVTQDWGGLWSAVSAGCVAQGQSLAERAVGWLGAMMGKKLAAPQASLLASLGAAVGQAAPGLSKLTASPGGWEALASRARSHWGPSTMEQAAPALNGHPGARDAALGMCVSDKRAAEEELARMLATFLDDKNELVLRLSAAMGKQGAGMGAGLGADAWSAAKKSCKMWASSVGKLARQGAVLPVGELERACAQGQWAKAYALALAGARPLEGQAVEPPLWQLCKARQQGTLLDAVSGAIPNWGSMPNDDQALDVAQALAGAGCRCSEKGPDGLDALQKLRSKQTSPAGALMEALSSLSAPSGSVGQAAPAKGRELAERGLGPLDDFLLALQEREQLAEVAGDARKGAAGSARL